MYMDAAAELGGNPVSKRTKFSLSMEMSRLTRDGTAETVSRDQILRHERGSLFSDHEQDWQPDPVDPYSWYMCDHTYMYASRQPYMFLFFFFFFSDVAFSGYFCTITVFSLWRE